MQGYAVSKTLAEKAAWKFAEENSLDLITIIPGVITGSSITPEVPGSVGFALSLLTANLKSIFSSEKLIKAGFSYNYRMEEMYDESVEYLRAVGLLAN
ncbi:anthocyanidin reductase ((2S)-flavan-3-ol-forming)-like [Magnolia sinica]|uniref:anthocyanidin reductase ((2S)-flavan-3-ol-forming)-like n=1 Tax=Magnolia sinica TaxID=86752 RepID=UPI00265847A7|nr:anthocyanidin reductase ((2S)-flavan-3-ol-forming)-like [Magnolia sinica]